ncbi:GNAT family N-acetyltransferase [Paenibacillus sp. XY044]|uniref:GNAT family N-acetyltransferase n=1 Tax=Paenibacillus sp. XY044 TaxID=2026089 RepID=UPI000B98754D|nr:GNAT family N-acetyltransferase [Paenibacillus sp. XY044]OZB98608.1 GNAT family N-acetyltransferase [Paenibacillus sp. XY044]
MEIQIRTGATGDMEEIMGLIARCVKVMQDGGSDQWDEQYPNRGVIGEDLKQGTLTVAVLDGSIAGIMVLDHHQDEQYDTVDWADTKGPHLMMHRLAVDPMAQGRGVARKLVAFAEHFATENGYQSIRLDTYAKNGPALKLYRGLGYDQRGEVNYPGREAGFPAFEKVFVHSSAR